MRVLVTGGSGYVGAHLVRRLGLAGHEVTVLSRAPSRHEAWARQPGVSWVAGGLANLEVVGAALPGHTALVHNALVWDDPAAERHLADVRAGAAIFELAGRAGVQHAIFTSSTAVHRPFLPEMDESAPLRPTESYGATKACGELHLRVVAREVGMRFNVVRLGPVLGPPAFVGAPFKSDARFTALVDAAQRDEDLHVVAGAGRQFIGADQAAEVYQALLGSSIDGETFLAVGERFVTWEEIAHLATARAGSRSRVQVAPAPEVGTAAHAEGGRFQVHKLRRVLGLAFDVEAALAAHLDHLASTFQAPN